MPPRKKRRKGDSKGSQSRHSTSLLPDLPLPALALIYQHCDDDSRKALLRVSAGCRDWVLREARSINLQLARTITTAARKPLARLLNRACTQSASSLTLCLDFTYTEHQGSRSRLLADLLKPGIQQSGWDSVGTLELYVRKAVKLSYLNADRLADGQPSSHLACRDPWAPGHLPS
jgi:hypothetical protein